MSHAAHPVPTPTLPADPGAGPRLAMIRQRLAAVRRVRRRRRFIAGWATLLIILAFVVITVFVCDWLFALPPLLRLASMVAATAAAAWTARRHVLPWFTGRESDLDLALEVERQQGLEGDLVAALQFDSPEAAAWGSRALRGAVVDYVATFGREWEIPRRVAGATPLGRMTAAAVLVAGIITACLLRPDFARAFLDRMAMGRSRYPTRTTIEAFSVGNHDVLAATAGDAVVTCPTGQPVEFAVVLGGALPTAGRLRITTASGGDENSLDMVPDPEGDARTFTARLSRLFEPVRAQVFVGDTWTEPVRLDVVPLPTIEMRLSAVAPDYAAPGAAAQKPASNVRHVAVFEGSRVGVDVSCANKRLRSAAVVIDGVEHPLEPSASGREWSLPTESSPLSRVMEPVTFDLRVVDEDGLSPDRPLTCSVRILRDARPRVTSAMATRVALPTAAPKLTWQVDDDHGIRDVSLLLETVAAEGERQSEPRVLPIAEMPASGWLAPGKLPLRGSLAIPLTSLDLATGQRLRLCVRATDYRGDLEGQTTVGDPLEIEIADEQGVLAALAEDDRRAIERLDAIVEKQLQVGGVEAPPSNPGGSR